MFEQISQKIFSYIPNLSPLLFFVLTLFICLYVFWNECARTRKNNSSVFDAFFVSIIFGVILGRIFYIIGNWEDFSKYIWYWLPYEKYGDEVFLFRVLPWRFFRVWDLGIDILFLLVGFFSMCTVWVLVVKKWTWSHLFPAIYLSSFSVLAVSFLFIGKMIGNSKWGTQGLIMVILILLFLLIKKILIKALVGVNEMKALLGVDSFFVLLSTATIVLIYAKSEILMMDAVALGIFVIWSLVGLLMHISDTRKATVTIERVSSVRHISIDEVKKNIRLPK
ncbi:MAG: hypothetical protein ACOX6Q_01765 [Candidatus Dojkabacteria bacterium]